MQLSDGYTDLPPGKIANVVTCLEMRERPPLRPEPPGSAWSLERIGDPRRYKAVLRLVGEPYFWEGRLAWSDADVEAVLRDERVEAYALRDTENDEGILELDFRQPRECELRYFGISQRMFGKGAGRWLMNRGLERAWSRKIDRVWLHTCSNDHPGAVQFYVRSGFTPYKRQIELGDDPRVSGKLPRAYAAHIPIL